MNQQDREAADTILMMEVEEKVKMRIMQVVLDVVYGNSGMHKAPTYELDIAQANSQIRWLVHQEIRAALNQARLTINI